MCMRMPGACACAYLTSVNQALVLVNMFDVFNTIY